MYIKIFDNPKYNKYCSWLILLYLVFTLTLLLRSSFVSTDGQRHFSLFDDAMISMRYADNLAHGHGLVWNRLEKLEGFTNPLMVFLMSGLIIIFGNSLAVLSVQVLGVGIIFLNLFFITKITKELLLAAGVYFDDLLLGVLFLCSGWYPLVYWSIFGMETGLLTSLVLASVYFFVKEETFVKFNWRMVFFLSLTPLTRPDSLLFLVVFFVFRFLTKARSLKTAMYVFLELLFSLVPIVAYQIFRIEYYGQVLPNTYILKATGMSLVDRVKNGLAYFSPFLERVKLMLVATILFLFFYFFDSKKKLSEKLKELFESKYVFALMFLFLFLVFSVYQVYIGGDPWPPFWRMTVPYTVLLFISFVFFLGLFKKNLNISKDIFLPVFWFLIAGFLIFVPFDYHYDFRRLEPYQTNNNKENFKQSLAINYFTKPEAHVLSFWAGTIPYYSNRYFIDPLGKMDSYIAKLPPDTDGPFHNRGMTSIPGHNKYDLDYSFKKLKPDAIVYTEVDGRICRWGKQDLQDWCLKNYVEAEYRGGKVLLMKDSPNIYWDKVTKK